MERLEQYAISDSVKAMHVGPYYGRAEFKQTLKMMQSETGIIVEGALLKRLREQGFEIDPERDNKSVYKPQAMFTALERYSWRGKSRVKDPLLDVAIDLGFKAFGFKGGDKLSPLINQDELRLAIKLQKSAGAPTFQKKGDAFEKDWRRMQRIATGERAPDPCVCYHRVQHGDEGPKQRMVWGYPLSMTLLEAQFARPLISNYLKIRTPLAFGLLRYELAARSLGITNSGVRYGLDFSRFDSSVPPWLISTAFSILKTWFRSEDLGNKWERIINYFIHTSIIMPDGNVYRKGSGIPSGSYFTQLVGSIANFIIIQYAMLKAVGKPVNLDKILVLGDDSLFGLDQHIPLDLLSKVLDALGFTMNVDKSDVSRFGEPWQFLGHIWIRGIVDRPTLDVVKRAIFPEKPNNIKDQRQRIAERMIAYYCDAKSAHSIYFAARRVIAGTELSNAFISQFPVRPVSDWQVLQVQEFGRDLPSSSLDLAYSGILM